VQIDAEHAQLAAPPLKVQVPFAGQATGVPHWPLDEHVWTALPEHCVLLGVHATQEPARHTGVVPTHVEEPCS
jgi:hypothetical protein